MAAVVARIREEHRARLGSLARLPRELPGWPGQRCRGPMGPTVEEPRPSDHALAQLGLSLPEWRARRPKRPAPMVRPILAQFAADIDPAAIALVRAITVPSAVRLPPRPDHRRPRVSSGCGSGQSYTRQRIAVRRGHRKRSQLAEDITAALFKFRAQFWSVLPGIARQRGRGPRARARRNGAVPARRDRSARPTGRVSARRSGGTTTGTALHRRNQPAGGTAPMIGWWRSIFRRPLRSSRPEPSPAPSRWRLENGVSVRDLVAEDLETFQRDQSPRRWLDRGGARRRVRGYRISARGDF